ncbi:hypothetical protein HRI_004682100 [Hibiscus trionum]|uniref:Endonuclease/exonuclease/phosphatase domain-containing protein n=1 Tax=Hibiscus trionum TaxID=183268 RepID=A0A9W7JB10_HIBTR|nr:hypothetical protein HRI_004682100 [Hibiscus trionum]
MNLEIISWNIRGLGRLEKARAVRNLIRERKPQFLFLQETKLVVFSKNLIRRMGFGCKYAYANSPAEGSAGGIICVWDPDCFVVSETIISKRYIILMGKFTGSNVVCGLVNLYGPSIDSEKSSFFQELQHVLGRYQVAWCLGGDFNAIIGPEEKVGFSWNFAAMEVFRCFIDSVELVNLPLLGGSFTWSNNRDPPTLVRLDRFLANMSFLELFPNLNQLLLSKSISDHNAIALKNISAFRGRRPFRFYNYLLEEEGFEDVMTDCIGKLKQRNLGFCNLMKGIKGSVKSWSSVWKKHKEFQSAVVEKQIATLEEKIQEGRAVASDLSELIRLKQEL